MKEIFILVILAICVSTCKKKDEPPSNNNEMQATVVISPSGTVNINAKGLKAKMGCASLGGGTYIDGTNDTNAAVYISAYDGIPKCITSPGTYYFNIEYRPNITDANTPIFGGSGNNLIITRIDAQHMEGSFTAVVCSCISTGCVFGVDSVIVSGSFKGDHLN